MTTVTAYEAKTHLARLLKAVERGDRVMITRYGKPVAELVPVADPGRDVAATIERMKRARGRRPAVPLDELLAARHEGHKY